MEQITSYIYEKLGVHRGKEKEIADQMVADAFSVKPDDEQIFTYEFKDKMIYVQAERIPGNDFNGYTLTYDEENFLLDQLGLKFGDNMIFLCIGVDATEEDVKQVVYHELTHVLWAMKKRPNNYITKGFQFDPEVGTPLQFFQDDSEDLKLIKGYIDKVLYVLWNPDETHAFQNYSVYKDRARVDEFCERFRKNIDALEEEYDREEEAWHELFLIFKNGRVEKNLRIGRKFKTFKHDRFKKWFIETSRRKYDDFYKKVIKNWKSLHKDDE